MAQHSTAVRAHQHASRQARDAADALDTATHAHAILVDLATQIQRTAHARIAAIVTKCLQDVFADDAYTFCIDFVRKRNTTEACAWFARDGHRVDPLTASGGGVVDVAAFALRIASIAMQPSSVRRVVILDEPFKFLSEEYRPAIGQMLQQLQHSLDFQIVMVTHIEDIVSGDVVYVG